jgi:hypothetical protein
MTDKLSDNLPPLPEPDAWRNQVQPDSWWYSDGAFDPREVHDNGKAYEPLLGPTKVHAYALSARADLQAEVDALRKDALRYRTMLENLESMVLRTEKGSKLTLTAKQRGAEFTRKGTDATLDGLADSAIAAGERTA